MPPSLVAPWLPVRLAAFRRGALFCPGTVRAADRQVVHQEVLANPHMDVEKAKGIRVGEWLVGLKTDIVVLREEVQGRGPAYVFADAGVETRLSDSTTLTQTLAGQTKEPNEEAHN